MPIVSELKRALWTLLAAGGLLASTVQAQAPADAQPTFDPLDKKWVGKYQMAAECQKCHTQPTAAWAQSLEFVLLTEYPIWKTHDEHAQSFAILFGSRSRQMGKILGGSEDYVLKPEAGCLNCHAMGNLMVTPEDMKKKYAPEQLKDLVAGKKKTETLPFDGVSCGGCHGPSADWNTEHIDPKKWRFKLNPKEKADKGFWDLRDPEVRSTLCLSCHVGNTKEGKVVTHAMYAAGHPPLPPIEIALFSKNEPQHWRDSKDVPYFQKALKEKDEQTIANYHLKDVEFQQTKLALIGGLVSMRETMELVRDRATLDAKNPRQVWPELLFGLDEKEAANDNKLHALAKERWPDIALAHSDCYACHHDLKFPGYRQQRGFGYHLTTGLVRTRPGRPLVRAWPTVLVEAGLIFSAGNEKAKFKELRDELQKLVDSWQSQPFGKPEAVAAAADSLVKWCERNIAELRNAKYDKDTTRRLLIELSKYYSSGEPAELIPDYETARQVVAVTKTIYDEYKLAAGGGDAQIEQTLAKLADHVDLYPYKKREERLDLVLKIIKENSQLKPTEDAMKAFSKYLSSNIGSMDALKEMMIKPNTFILAIAFTTNEALTDAFVKASNQLQALNNQELEVYLKTVNDFDPRTFRAEMARFHKLMSP